MLHGMEAMLKRVEALESDHQKIKCSHIIAILLFIIIIVYIVYDGIVGNMLVEQALLKSPNAYDSIVTRQFVYDDEGRLEAQLEFNLANEVIWKRLFEYDENGNNILYEDYNKDGAAVRRIECTFDDHGREIDRVKTDLIKEQSEHWQFTYDEKGAKVRAFKNNITNSTPSTG